MTGELVRRDDLSGVVARLSDDSLGPAERRRLLVRLAALLGAGARAAGARAAVTGAWLADVVADLAPHLPVRDLLTLREHHGGLSGDALADALVAGAARSTALVGAAAGALATAELVLPGTLLAVPLQLAAETLVVVAIELKLVAELHVVYGQAAAGSRTQQATTYLLAWSNRHSKWGAQWAPSRPAMGSVLSAAARIQLRGRLVRRMARNVTTLAPFLAGALAGAELNRRETSGLGEKLIRDLQKTR